MAVHGGSVKVRETGAISRSFTTDGGDRIEFSFYRAPFYISRETDVEVV
jgi:hypothetical protein